MKKVISEDMVRGPSSQVRLVNLGPKAIPFGPDVEFDDRITMTRLMTKSEQIKLEPEKGLRPG